MDTFAKHRQALKSRICQIIDGMEGSPSLEDVARALYQAAGYEPFPWHIEDIRCAWAQAHGAEPGDCPLTDAECMDILERLRRRHDADIGINWEVIRCYVDGDAP